MSRSSREDHSLYVSTGHGVRSMQIHRRKLWLPSGSLDHQKKTHHKLCTITIDIIRICHSHSPYSDSDTHIFASSSLSYTIYISYLSWCPITNAAPHIQEQDKKAAIIQLPPTFRHVSWNCSHRKDLRKIVHQRATQDGYVSSWSPWYSW